MQGTTLYMTVLGGWAALLGRLSGQEEVVIGTPTANRGRSEIEKLIGFFVNTLAMRMEVGGVGTVGELLEEVKEQALGAQQNQEMPFEQVVELMQPVRSLAHSALFQVMFAWQNTEQSRLELEGVEVEPLRFPRPVAKFDMTLSLQPVEGRIRGGVGYATALFERETVERYVGYLRRLLKGMVEGGRQALVDELPLLSEEERRQVLYQWNETEVEYGGEQCVHELFEEQVRDCPHALAIVQNERKLTYAELNCLANQMARYLRSLGLQPGESVALLLERSIDLVIAELAVLKCGAVYVPLDPSFPQERKAFMVADTSTRFVLCSERTQFAEKTSVQKINIAMQDLAGFATDDLKIALHSDATAYVMYTSGSTGQPKGIMIPHRGIKRLVLNNGYARFDADVRMGFVANPTFDPSTLELWAPLLHGGVVVVIPQEEVLDSGKFRQALKRQAVNVLVLTAGLFHQFADALLEEFAALRYLIVGGDVLDPQVVSRVLRGNSPEHLLNVYGPTEATTLVATYEIAVPPENLRRIPIGRPISNTQLYILNEASQPVPIGVTGELYIGGAGLAHGYCNRPELTAERFVPNMFSGEPGARMYRTGDLCRWKEDGTVDFIGRNDFQVKVRGFRIELEEIEARLARLSRNWQCGGGGAGEMSLAISGLVAYYTCGKRSDGQEEEVGAEQLRRHVGSRLPEYMVPAAYVRMEKIPLTRNGKLDRRALPEPEGDAYVQHGYEAPVGEVETVLAGIWAEVLKVERVGRQDNFFELGGHSLLAVRVVSRVRQVVGVEVGIREMFARPVLGEFAQAVKVAGRSVLPPVGRVERTERMPLSFAQQRLWFLAQMGVSRAYHIPVGMKLRGALDGGALRRALDRIVERHEALRTRFVQVEGEPVQRIEAAEGSRFHLLEHDLRGL